METSVKTDLIDKIVGQERQCHLAFFGKEFDLTEFADTLKKYGEEKIKFWQNLGLEPHFLPKVSMMPNDNYPGWKIKPESWFYQKIAEGKIFRRINGELKKVEIVALEGISVLIDARLKPNYVNGEQMWENDNLCGPIIEKLRKAAKIADYNPQSSRFNVSADEWEDQIKPAISELLKVDLIVLEPAIVANAVPQIYPYMPRKDDGNTNTWCWYEEYFEHRGFRLDGGDSGVGGLADVFYNSSDSRWFGRSCRPLAVL